MEGTRRKKQAKWPAINKGMKVKTICEMKTMFLWKSNRRVKIGRFDFPEDYCVSELWIFIKYVNKENSYTSGMYLQNNKYPYRRIKSKVYNVEITCSAN